jgi:hypothetical protein
MEPNEEIRTKIDEYAMLYEDQQKLVAPSVEVVGVDVEDDVDKAPDVVDGDGLGVKVEEGGGLLE